ncbi:hypothetical protein BCUN_2111 [Bifidobacterium cuniculi]|uniref:Uncharacterized protein n=1 Tax=Bifidobacterium cuniculi TaxID=1688 RepID=A0A087AZP6_9BIFI|nr:hypothetical protein BCUN_2111 [Bifidobacterium cuniculi]
MDEEQSRDYIARIADIIEPMEPLVVYLDNPDVRTTVDRVLDERGNDWLEAVTAYHVRQGYGLEHGLQGYDGYIACLEERKRRERHILQSLPLASLTLSRDLAAWTSSSSCTTAQDGRHLRPDRWHGHWPAVTHPSCSGRPAKPLRWQGCFPTMPCTHSSPNWSLHRRGGTVALAVAS